MDWNERYNSLDGKRLEFMIFLGLLAIFNFPLIGGRVFGSMVFWPGAVADGAWWRVLTHPFVHLSWYHLLLDAGAFLLLYEGIEEQSRIKRLVYVTVCGVGSLVFALFTTHAIYTKGLCGLSGTAHGLMAVSALEMMARSGSDRRTRIIGVLTLGTVVGKSAIELVQGRVLFDFLHFGLMGLPIASCHAGGVLSGAAAFLVMAPWGGSHPMFRKAVPAGDTPRPAQTAPHRPGSGTFP